MKLLDRIWKFIKGILAPKVKLTYKPSGYVDAGRKIKPLWTTDIRQWRFNNKIMREARLIKHQGCNYFNINGVQVFAFNQRNAERKYDNLIKNRNR